MNPNTIAIVGGGPGGLKTATHLSQNGLDCVVIEEHSQIGLPENCSGLVSIEGSRKADLPVEECLVNQIRGAHIFSPNHSVLTIERSKPIANLINRSKLDALLAKTAQKSGANIRLNTRLIDIRKNTLFLESRGRGEILKASQVVGSDGPNSKTRNLMGIQSTMNDFIHSFQVKATGIFDPDFVELYFGGFAWNFFGWIIPENKNNARIGLGCKTGLNPKKQFDAFVQQKKLDIDVLEESSFLIPCRKPLDNLVADNKLLVGDAAFQTKATSIDFEEPILIEENGLLKNVRIGEVVNQKLEQTPQKAVFGKKPKITVGHPNSLVKAFSPTIGGEKPQMRSIRSVLKHPIDEELYEIILEKGYRVKATASHSVMVAGRAKFKEKKVVDLVSGQDSLPLVLKVPNNTSIEKIDIIKTIKENPSLLRIAKKINVKGQKNLLFKKSTEVPKKRLSQYWSNDTVPLSIFIEKDIPLNNVTLSFENSTIRIPSIITITPELCRLVGYYIAEGSSATEKKISLSFGINDMKKGIVTDAIHCIKQTFNVSINKQMQKNPITNQTNGIKLYFGGQLLAKLFSEMVKGGKTAKTKEVPYIIFNVPDHLKIEFLKGYLRGDGTIRIRKCDNRKNWSAEISCKTVSRKLASDLVILALQLDLFPSIEEFSTGIRYWNNQRIGKSQGYKVSFSKKSDLLTLSTIFPEKQVELLEFLENIVERETITLPKVMVENLSNQHYEKEIYQEFGPSISAYQNLALTRVGTATQTMQTKNACQQFIHNISASKIAFLKIKQIRKVKPSHGEVFDVEIPETNMFVGGIGPILLHNTGGGVVMASLAGQKAGESIFEHVVHKKPLDNYNKKTQDIKKDLDLHWKIHNYLSSLKDEEINKLFEKLKKANVEQFLQEEGNMDFPTKFIPKLLRNPRMLGFLPHAFKLWRS
ncbi:geranylgeranyl reductase family protein [Candidatus Micrarchaeota archaeon]|nr:geranylgeranyl reductase family protein [Candidatus Micrarchaeota archaeon]MBU1930255.1 geranylgeranyl reductase family protein [Candidatus Micrarchaeota archaeon]